MWIVEAGMSFHRRGALRTARGFQEVAGNSWVMKEVLGLNAPDECAEGYSIAPCIRRFKTPMSLPDNQSWFLAILVEKNRKPGSKNY
jgi:hypothetical protein